MATKSLFVGNLPYTAGERELFDFFSAYAPASVRIVEGRGFGFVDIPDDQADACVETMNGKELGGRKVVVNEARPKGSGNGGGGGGGYRSGGGGGGGGGRDRGGSGGGDDRRRRY